MSPHHRRRSTRQRRREWSHHFQARARQHKLQPLTPTQQWHRTQQHPEARVQARNALPLQTVPQTAALSRRPRRPRAFANRDPLKFREFALSRDQREANMAAIQDARLPRAAVRRVARAAVGAVPSDVDELLAASCSGARTSAVGV